MIIVIIIIIVLTNFSKVNGTSFIGCGYVRSLHISFAFTNSVQSSASEEPLNTKSFQIRSLFFFSPITLQSGVSDEVTINY